MHQNSNRLSLPPHLQPQEPTLEERVNFLSQMVDQLHQTLGAYLTQDAATFAVVCLRGAVRPTLAKEGDVCVDVQALAVLPPHAEGDARDFDEVRIPPGGYRTFATGLKFLLPVGFRMRSYSKSGLARKHGVLVGAGVIDNGYTGEVNVVVHNLDPYDTLTVRKGDYIGQLGFDRYTLPVIKEIDEETFEKVLANMPSLRGTSGWGSSGRNPEERAKLAQEAPADAAQ